MKQELEALNNEEINYLRSLVDTLQRQNKELHKELGLIRSHRTVAERSREKYRNLLVDSMNYNEKLQKEIEELKNERNN